MRVPFFFRAHPYLLQNALNGNQWQPPASPIPGFAAWMVFASWIIQARSPASHNWPLSISPRKYQKAARYLYGESFNISIQKLLFIHDCLRNHCCLLEAQKKPDHTIAQGAKLPPQILKTYPGSWKLDRPQGGTSDHPSPSVSVISSHQMAMRLTGLSELRAALLLNAWTSA